MQVFITLGLALTYKKSLAMIFIFYFLNRFWETTEIIDRAIESDIRDYQQYLSGERIDGSFGVVDTYVGGAVGAVTNLFIPWVYRRNGFDGTDYSVLNVYDDFGNYKTDNILYTLLDKLLLISLIGAAVDVIPWFFYDLTDTEQKAVAQINRIRSAAEDRAAGVAEDDAYCEACEAIFAMRENLNKTPREKLTKDAIPDGRDRRAANRAVKEENERVGAAEYVSRELERYTTEFGEALLTLCWTIDNLANEAAGIDPQLLAAALPRGATKEERTLRDNAVRMARAVIRARRQAEKHPDRVIASFDAAAFEALFDLPEETPEQRKEKRAAIRQAEKERKAWGRQAKPYLWARRHLLLAQTYADPDAFLVDYPEAKRRRDGQRAAQAREAEEAKARRAAAAVRKRSR